MEEINPITEQVLYCISNTEQDLKTRSICNKFEYRDSLVKSQLQQLRDRGLVSVEKVHEYGGNAKATNYYELTDLGQKYEKLYGLSVPKYDLRQDNNDLRQEFDEYKEYDQQWRDTVEQAINDLDDRVEDLESIEEA